MINKKVVTSKFGLMLISIVALAVIFSGCSNSAEAGISQESRSLTESMGEQAREDSIEHGGEGSEGGGEHGGSGESSGEHGGLGEAANGVTEAAGEHGGHSEGAVTVSQGAHERDTGEGGEGDESGTEYGLDEVYDATRNGARLVLAYDAQNNAFVGAVANITNSPLTNVRVEVHLSNGTELGPTNPVDLPAGKMMQVVLPATGEPFDGWSAHPEVGNLEHGSGSESSEGSGEHGGSGETGGEHGSAGESGGEHGGG